MKVIISPSASIENWLPSIRSTLQSDAFQEANWVPLAHSVTLFFLISSEPARTVSSEMKVPVKPKSPSGRDREVSFGRVGR